MLTFLLACLLENNVNVKPNDPIDTDTGSVVDSGDTQETGSQETGDSSPPFVGEPIAVCSVTPSVVDAIYGTAEWIGNTSYDTNGQNIVGFEWTLLSSPAGSTANISSATPNVRNFVPDLAGDYVAQLIVTNDIGQVSEPCVATLTANAGDGLWIEMFWTHSGDDMDLHLLKPSGVLGTNTDCYYANCTTGVLDWGVRGVTDDDPILDLDDIPGTGPENINIDYPVGGAYTVFVHDYPGSAYIGENNVTVNVYVGGYLYWTDTRNIDNENYFAPICQIDWRGTATTITEL